MDKKSFNIKRGISVVLLLAVFVVWLWRYLDATRSLGETPGAALSWESASLSYGMLDEARAQEAAADHIFFFLWEEQQGAVRHPETGVVAGAAVRSGYGDMERAMGGRLLAGGFLLPGDTDGCMVSQAIADKLWGSINVLGKRVEIGEGTYYVRGVLAGHESIAYVGSDEADRAFGHLASCFGPEAAALNAVSTQKALSREFLQRWNLPNPKENRDLHWEAEVEVTLLRLGFIAMAALLLWRFLKRGEEKGWISTAIWLLLLLAALWLWGFGVFTLPEDWIPPAWSDFGFWSQKWSELKQKHLR